MVGKSSLLGAGADLSAEKNQVVALVLVAEQNIDSDGAAEAGAQAENVQLSI